MPVASVGHKESGYIPIPLESMRVGTLLAFDLFIARDPEREDRSRTFVLYRKRDLPIKDDHIGRLIDSGVDTLFIKADDRSSYRRYLESNLHPILTDDRIEISKKVEIVYEAASGLVEDIWLNPASPEAVTRSVSLVNDTFTAVVKQKNSIRYLLSVMSNIYTTYTHSVNVCLYSLALANQMNMGADVVQDLGLGTLLHDVGKTKVDKKILEKKGPLTPEEMRIVKCHPQYGVDILKRVPRLPDGVYRVVLEHHEKCDGSGYPQGLKQDQIHPHSRITCLIDVFDALSSDRPYKKAVSAYEALRIMRDEMTGCFEHPLWRQLAALLTVTS